ncbi:MAG TPA: hypothetical protein VFN67_21295 [Polyangiales bacterium]|jgi:hypothetical protein|nr:hypothetical protein [Polyangiales bacterium]
MNIPSRKSRRRARQREGAVMLVVLLIVLTATTLAATSLQSTQFELRGAGYTRAAVQTQYVSEAAAMTTLAWIDATSMDRSFMTHVKQWSAADPPPMWPFGEPEIFKDNEAQANRTQWVQQQLLTTVGMAPLTNPGDKNAAGVVDKYGTLGPRSTYVAGIQTEDGVLGNYIVDMYDCRRLTNTAAAGYQVNQGGSGTMQYFQLYCVVTSHGRTYVPYPTGAGTKPSKVWTVRGRDKDETLSVNRFTMAHDSRGAVITPPMSQ